MAVYCSKCSPFSGEFDIDLFKIALTIKNCRSVSFICEGCNIRAIYKDENGNLYLARSESNEIKLYPVFIKDLMN